MRSAWPNVGRIGSSAAGFGLKIDGVIVASDPCMMRLAAKVDALMAGASDYNADFIAKAIARRPWRTHQEVMAVYVSTGGPEPSRDPFGGTMSTAGR